MSKTSRVARALELIVNTAGLRPAVFVGLLAVVLQFVAIEKQSLVGDGAYHLLAGHQALRYGENRLNLEHPPLVKLVAALPLLAEAPLAPPLTVERVLPESLRVFEDRERFERVRGSSRLLVLVVFGVPLLAACWCLGYELGGHRVGTALLGAVGLSIPVVANLSILQTDTAVTLGFTVTVVAALRYWRRPSLRRAAWLGLGVGLAASAKFSGVLVLPVAAVALAAAPSRRWRRRLGDATTVGLVATASVWATYAVANRSYDPEAGRDTIRRYCRGEALLVGDRMKPYEEPLLAVERVSPSLAQWLTGLIGIRLQNEIGVYPSYAFGILSSQGHAWYFPAVFLVRTPLAVLLMLVLWGVERLRRRWGRPESAPAVLFAVTLAVYLGMAMTSTYNLGIRHLLPVLPLLYLPAALWASRATWRSAVLVGVLALESLLLTPFWMSATNTWWLGAANPTRFAFSIGDAEYRQSFIALADVARRRRLEPLHVLYPALDAAELHAYVPGAVLVEPGSPPLAGGWYAVSTTLEQYLPAISRADPDEVRAYASLAAMAEAWRPLVHQIAENGDDHGYAAATFHLYRLP